MFLYWEGGEFIMSIGKVIQSLRERLGISQKELADKIDISYSVMNRIESGERPTRDAEIKRIAKALDVSPNYLLGVSSDKERKYMNHYEIPSEFMDPEEARNYIAKHKMFGSNQLDLDLLDDDEILEFANAMLEQIKIVSYKFKK